MTTLEPANPATGPTPIPGVPVWLPADDEQHTELVDIVLDAAYPAEGGEPGVMPQEELDRIVEATLHAPRSLDELAGARRRMADRIIEALAGRLHELWQADADASAVELLDVVRDGQHVRRDTLRTWAVYADQITDRAAARHASAAWGARELADQIRRELVHPSDVPELAADTYRDEQLFDRKRAVPDSSDTNTVEQEIEQA